MEKANSKVLIGIIVGLALLVLVLFFLFVTNNDSKTENTTPDTAQNDESGEETPEPDDEQDESEDESGEGDNDTDEESPDDADQTSTSSNEAALPDTWNNWSAAERLSYLKRLSQEEKEALWQAIEDKAVFWQSLSLPQQLVLNPYNCRTNAAGYINFRADTGECQGDSRTNSINLNVIQKNERLWAVWDGGPQKAEYVNGGLLSTDDTITRPLSLVAFRVETAASCHPGSELPEPNSYRWVPFANQHWIYNTIFNVGRYDIGNYICLYATETVGSSDDTTTRRANIVHTQAVQVAEFTIDADDWQIKFNTFDAGKLDVHADTYLATNRPAWEYIGPRKVSGGDATTQPACNAQSFTDYADEVVSKTFTEPQHLFQRFGNGFEHHYTKATVALTIDLTAEDAGSFFCIRIRNSFGQVKYKGDIIPDSLSYPIIVT